MGEYEKFEKGFEEWKRKTNISGLKKMKGNGEVAEEDGEFETNYEMVGYHKTPWGWM